MITQAKLGWMAGVIDFKGRVVIKNNQTRAEGSRQIVLVVECKAPGIIRELNALTGNKAESFLARPLKEFMRRSCHEHCPEAHIHVNDDRVMPAVQRWTITGTSLAIVAESLIPLLTDDKGLPELQVEILDRMDLNGRAGHMIVTTINRLQSLGWPLPAKILQALERREVVIAQLMGGGNGTEIGEPAA